MSDAAGDDFPLSELGKALAWLGAAAGNVPQAAEEQEASEAVAGMLADASGEQRRALWDTGCNHRGLLRAMRDLDAESCAAVALELAEHAGYGYPLCALALDEAARAATKPEEVLEPGTPDSLLLLAYQSSEQGAEYLAGLSAGGALLGTAVPARISRPLARLHEAAMARFGDDAALALAAAHLGTRLLPVEPEAAVLFDYTRQVIAAGEQAELLAAEGDDPDDLLIQRGAALESLVSFAMTFAEPTPSDPLGTLPTRRLTTLGQAILKARAARPHDYDWGAVLDARAEDPDAFADLQADERAIVLDLVLEQAGIAAVEPTAGAAE